jgi:iron complex transport system substrate-binding protein
MKPRRSSGIAAGGLVALAALLWAAPMLSAADAQTPASKRPQRIVSMNLCTDELLMRLVEPSRIASITNLSQQAVNEPLGLTPISSKLKVNHGLAEEILLAEPDLIIAGSYTTTTAIFLLRKLGHEVVTFDPENNLQDMRANVRKMGKLVGEEARAEQVIAEFDARLKTLQAQLPPGELPIFADIAVNNYIAGNDTFYAEVVNAGGWRTIGQALGYSKFRSVSLEELLKVRPALISTATPWTNPPSLSTLALRHPALQRLVDETPNIVIPERFTTCGTPAVMGAIELLVAERRRQAGRPQ